MLHDAQFARAAAPNPVTILGLPMRPYSIGHEIFLIRRQNPFLALQLEPENIKPPTASHLIEAILICAHSWHELNSSSPPFFTLKTRLWRSTWLNKTHDQTLAAIPQFIAYRNAGSTQPPTAPPLLEPGQSKPREPGSPFLLRLIQFLIFRLRMTEQDAMDYPLGLAIWHACAFAEAQDEIRIENKNDRYMKQFVADAEAEAAAEAAAQPQPNATSPAASNGNPVKTKCQT
jgi:hypothetical protein